MVAIGKLALLGVLLASATALHMGNKDGQEPGPGVCQCRPWKEAYSTRFHKCTFFGTYGCDDFILKMKNTSSCLSDWTINVAFDNDEMFGKIEVDHYNFVNTTEQYCIVDAQCPEGDRAAHWKIKTPKDPAAALGLWKRKRCGADDSLLNQETLMMLEERALAEGLDLGMLLKFAYPQVMLSSVTGTLQEELEKTGTAGIVVNDGSFVGHLAPLTPFDVVTPCGIMTVSGDWMKSTSAKKTAFSGAACEQYEKRDTDILEARKERERLARRKWKDEKIAALPQSLVPGDYHWEKGEGVNCYEKEMLIPNTKGVEVPSVDVCKTICLHDLRCHGITYARPKSICFIRQNVDLAKCKKSDGTVSFSNSFIPRKLDPEVAELHKMMRDGASEEEVAEAHKRMRDADK